MLLELSPFPQVPGAHRVIQTSRPQLRTIMRDIYAAGTVCVALELPLKNKTTQIFKGNTGREPCRLLQGSWSLGALKFSRTDCAWKPTQEHPLLRSTGLAKPAELAYVMRQHSCHPPMVLTPKRGQKDPKYREEQPLSAPALRPHLTSVWLCRSHTAMLPSLQQEKQTLASGLMARA